jgi:chlorite dismutase
MNHNILIIGTGIYGCHAAMVLKELNLNFKMADISNDFFTGSSSKNQNRLHKGFHYARSYSTRHECIIGYNKFINAYPFAAKIVDKNYYLVDKESIIDFKTYKHIYEHENIPFTITSTPELPFEYNHELFDENGDAFLTNERFVDFNELKSYFTQELNHYLIKNYNQNKLIVTQNNINYNGEDFDYLIDCTYSQLKYNFNCTSTNDIFYELCIAFLYEFQDKIQESFAFTVMDGAFFSIYPYNINKNIYSLTDVQRTPIIKTKNINEIYTLRKNIKESDINQIKTEFEINVKKYIPDFEKHFKYHDYYLAIKTKPNKNSDDRSLMYENIGEKIHRFSGGKLTGIFSMEDKLKQLFQI